MSTVNDCIDSMGEIFKCWLVKPHRAGREADANRERFLRTQKNKPEGWSICEFKRANNKWFTEDEAYKGFKK